MRRTKARNRRRMAFTLLEVMLVLVIIAAIASIAVFNLGAFQTRAYTRTAKAEISTLKNALDQYRIEIGSYPQTLDALYEQPSDIADPTKWMRILDKPVKPDPWNHAYEYTVNGAEVEIRSLGPDGQSGTEDDISSKN